MSEILERGELPENKTTELRCGKCASLIRFKYSEGELVYDQRDGDFYRFTCPVCKSQITRQK